MILLNTAPIVALCDPRDRLNPTALRDLERLAGGSFVACAPILAETCFLLTRPDQRQRLRRFLADFSVAPYPAIEERALWDDVFEWLERYADHAPDWADGCLAVVAGRERRARVWTYDSEFRTTWRRLDGSRVPLAVR